jgi:zinc protease
MKKTFLILCAAALLGAAALPAPAAAKKMAAPAAAPETPGAKKILDIAQVTSPGGISAWLVEDHSLPIISLRFGFRGAGAAGDPAAMQGLALMASNTLDEGAGDYDSQSFQKTLADNSIDLGFSASRDNFSGGVRTLARNRQLAFDLLRLALTKPRFDDEAVGRMRDANLSRIRSSLVDPEWVAARLMNDTAFEGHPYSFNSGGTLTTLAKITPDALRDFVRTRLTRDRLVVAVVGDISRDELAAMLDSVFGGLPQTADLPPVPDTEIKNGGAVVLHEMDIPQTIVEMAQPGIRRDDPQYQAAQVMNYILGGAGFGSRLMAEVREKRGLAYGIDTGLADLDHAPSIMVSSATKNETAGELLKLVDTEWKKMHDTDVTPKELDDAKAYLIGSVPMSLSSSTQISSLMLSLELEGLPADYLDRREKEIKALTIKDIRAVSERLLTPGRLTTVLVGKPEGVIPTRTVEKLPNVE